MCPDCAALSRSVFRVQSGLACDLASTSLKSESSACYLLNAHPFRTTAKAQSCLSVLLCPLASPRVSRRVAQLVNHPRNLRVSRVQSLLVIPRASLQVSRQVNPRVTLQVSPPLCQLDSHQASPLQHQLVNRQACLLAGPPLSLPRTPLRTPRCWQQSPAFMRTVHPSA